MNTSATPELRFDIKGAARIPSATLGYFEARLSRLVHQALLELFGRLERQCDFTKRTLARRIGRRPEQLTRWLSYPTNLTLETVSDILAGLGYELDSLVFANLATGHRTRFPQRPDVADLQVTMQPAYSRRVDSEIAALQSAKPSQPERSLDRTSKLAAATFEPRSPGKAESDQMNIHNFVNKQMPTQRYAV